MSRLIPNVFRVFQFIPNTIGNRGSRVFKRLPAFSKGSRLFADMSINHASARALPVLYQLLVFVLVQRYIVHADLHFERSSDSALVYIFVHFPSVSWSVVIGYMNWCGFFIHTRREELLDKSITRLIMNLNNSIQSKIVQELFVV